MSRLSLSGTPAAGELLKTTSVTSGLLSSARLEDAESRPQGRGLPMLSSEVLVRFHFRQRGPRKTQSRRFPGHIEMYDKKDGHREPLYAAVERYKRLDWGAYITTKQARFRKKWKTWDSTNWMREQHGSMDQASVLKLERMFSHEIKLPRYIPDDPYDKYNSMPFWKHRAGLIKNRKLIEKYGNTDHMYGRYYAHAAYRGKPNILPKHYYMPPDYLKTIASNAQKVYKPDVERVAPSNEPAPYFQRKKVLIGKEQRELKELEKMRRQERYLKEPLPLWNEAFHPTVHRR